MTKQRNPDADTTAWEREIDKPVYELYGLTYEEVKIVDPEFWMTKEEYEKVKTRTHLARNLLYTFPHLLSSLLKQE